jgi:hypothetical protein
VTVPVSYLPRRAAGANHLANRVRRKLGSIPLQPELMALVDALADIHPRRTDPAAVDIIVSEEGRVFVIFEGDRPHYIAWAHDVRDWLRALATLAALSQRERAWFLARLPARTGCT